ncbi:hypothetical protein QQS21_010267 [Conoideocrella luteorostrata]|uniref:Uncharacterized protein n=1 Tax=Conoideocrella luteorostrata TaxID=1105319 RepID=A0AAJ0FUC3_9HYPO|nr:hypothetical protein QQS21_010267 [Conoideocrella luteorostrata]
MSEPSQNPPLPTTTGARRRSSGWMPAFESLQTHKNNQDAVRRQSMSDQQSKAGMFGQLFHNYFGRNSK